MCARLPGRSARAVLTRIESIVLPEGRWRVLGSRKSELVIGPSLRGSRLAARMAGGDDRVIGGPGPDLLVGGAGRDLARPGAGRDVCRSIERERENDLCEVRRQRS